MKYLNNLRNRLVGQVALSGLALLIAGLPVSYSKAQDNQDSQISTISEDETREQRKAELRRLMGSLTYNYSEPKFGNVGVENLESALEAASQVKGPENDYVELRTGGKGSGEVGTIQDFNDMSQPVIPLDREAPRIYQVPGSEDTYLVKMCGVNADEQVELATISLENRQTGETNVVESTLETEDGPITVRRKVNERQVYARVQTKSGILEYNLSDNSSIIWEPQHLSPDEEGCTYSL